MALVFIPPTAYVRPMTGNRFVKHPGHSLWKHYRPNPAGTNVWLLPGGVVTTTEPEPGAPVERVFHGGHLHEVSEAEAALLRAAGFTVSGEPDVVEPPVVVVPTPVAGIGSASGTAAYVGSAVGVRPATGGVSTGTASGSSAFMGTAVGRRVPKGVATGTAAYSGSAVGDNGEVTPVTWDVIHSDTFDGSGALTSPWVVSGTSATTPGATTKYAQTSGVLYNEDSVEVAWVVCPEGRRQRVTSNGHPYASDMSRGAIYGVFIRGTDNAKTNITADGFASSRIGWEIAKTNTESKVVLYGRNLGTDVEWVSVPDPSITIGTPYELQLFEEIGLFGLDVVGWVNGVERARKTLSAAEERTYSGTEAGLVNFRGFSNNYDVTIETETPAAIPAELAGYKGDMAALTVVSNQTQASAVLPGSTWDTTYANEQTWMFGGSNVVLQNLWIQGGVYINEGSGRITFKNCVIDLNGAFHMNGRVTTNGPFTRMDMVDTTVRFSSGSPRNGSAMVGGAGGGPTDGSRFARCDFSDGSDLLAVLGDNVVVEDCWFHDVYIGELADNPVDNKLSHSNSMHCYRSNGARIRRNRFDGPTGNWTGADACIFFQFGGDVGTSEAVIEHNRIFGGHIGMVLENGARLMRVRNNIFAGGYQYGAATVQTGVTISEWSGNVDGSGNPVNQPAFS